MGFHNCAIFLCLSLLSIIAVEGRWSTDKLTAFNFAEKSIEGSVNITGKRWAVLVAGSLGYENYRHQADVCHAYQILKKGGLKDENIIVFMYDDIAYNPENPRQGIIINKPNGTDVYAGVPKDYTGSNCTAENLYAVILGNKTALTGGSGKVLDTSPDDHIFIYYTDHGGSGIISMPVGDFVYANDLVRVLQTKYETGTYSRMVFYLEACESGSMFEGLLPENINIYAVTASNSTESSWAAYCPGDTAAPPPEYDTCLGDLFSISWMEDSDVRDLRNETLNQQYEVVKSRTINGTSSSSYHSPEKRNSHVMQYGNLGINKDLVYIYMGSNPANDNSTLVEFNSSPSISGVVSQYDADLLHFWHKYNKAPKGSRNKEEAQEKLVNEINSRKQVDYAMNYISTELLGHEKGLQVLESVRSPGKPLVDDWDRFKTLVQTYEKYCGTLSRYGRGYTRVIANMCNAGINGDQMGQASAKACNVKA